MTIETEGCTPEELSLEGIRKRAENFNHWLGLTNVGFKTYEVQAIEVLLAENARLREVLESYMRQGTFGSPYGDDGLKGAIAHHQMWNQVFERALAPKAP